MESDKHIIELGYEFINFDESLLLSDYRHVVHCSIYSPKPFTILKEDDCKGHILMQMRFDGHLGFAGGYIDSSDKSSDLLKVNDIVDALNRELSEELNLDSKFFVCKENYSFTNISRDQKRCFHFFSKEVSVEDFVKIEKNSLDAKHHGSEVLGLVRVPLITFKDNFRGFPAFLSNHFAGCSRNQLLNFLLIKNLSSYDYITQSLSQSKVKQQ